MKEKRKKGLFINELHEFTRCLSGKFDKSAMDDFREAVTRERRKERTRKEERKFRGWNEISGE